MLSPISRVSGKVPPFKQYTAIVIAFAKVSGKVQPLKKKRQRLRPTV